jgi:uncharacterized repeat protein (TIGR01451 family)
MVTVTYSVTVDAPETGDYSLVNAAVPDAPGGACADGALPKPSCSPVEVLVQAYSVAKVASAATVLPGGTVTYTITVTNTGKVDYTEAAPASFADDLTKVLDDATFSGDAQASAGAVNYSAPTLAWAGALPVGGTATVTYAVTVNAPVKGDYSLLNAAVPDGPGGTCADGTLPKASCSPTEVLVQAYTVAKKASTAQTSRGGKVTYTITVTNTGKVDYPAAAPASFTDSLTKVLDDATYNGDAAASAGAVKFGSPTLSWAGPLPVGGHVTVTYTVTVKKKVSGDYSLVNAAMPNGPGGGCEDGTPPTPSCSSVTVLVAAYTVTKVASRATLRPGDTVSYTITVTNIGKVSYTKAHPATFADDLSDVLDDASYNNNATNGATVKQHTLSWAGALPTGRVVAVTYSVTVHDPDTGNGHLHNVVTTPADPNGIGDANCPIGSPDSRCFADTGVEGFGAAPAATGSDSALELLLGGLLLGFGALLVFAGRRRCTS